MRCWALNHYQEHSSYYLRCRLMYYFPFFRPRCKNANRLKGRRKTSRRLRPNARSPPPFVWLQMSQRRRDTMRTKNTTRNILGCCFLLIGSIHQRIYKACYLNAIFFYQNDNTIHKYSCLSSTDPSSSRVPSCTWRVSQTAGFHILVIILSVIDRNKPCNIHL